MKIAFVGKGGSGKSTVGALFINYLIDQKHQVLAIDADINQHLAGMIGAELKPEKALYFGDNSIEVRTILRGSNKRIESAKRFVKTTPPGEGSHIIRLEDQDPVLSRFAVKFAGDNYFVHAGTYDKDGIGISCYHSNLAVIENVLSHTATHDDQWLVADMVAGTDAFAGALHIMFDAIFMVVEPTPESVSVFAQFLALACGANVDNVVFAIGNKVMDEDDVNYLRKALGDTLVVSLPHDAQLRKARQRGESLQHLSVQSREQMGAIAQVARDSRPDADAQLRKLHVMHQRFATQDFTIAKHGDITTQIDEAFSLRP